MAEDYCVKCKLHTRDVNPHIIHGIRDRRASTCAVCGSKKSTFISMGGPKKAAKKKKKGDGIFEKIPFIGKTLDSIGNAALGVVGPALGGLALKRFGLGVIPPPPFRLGVGGRGRYLPPPFLPQGL